MSPSPSHRLDSIRVRTHSVARGLTPSSTAALSHGTRCPTGSRRGIRHLTTQPYRPRTNRKVERFHQTMAREWATGSATAHIDTATGRCHTGLQHYNTRRPHNSLGDRPPISRVHNVRGQDN